MIVWGWLEGNLICCRNIEELRVVGLFLFGYWLIGGVGGVVDWFVLWKCWVLYEFVFGND